MFTEKFIQMIEFLHTEYNISFFDYDCDCLSMVIDHKNDEEDVSFKISFKKKEN